MREITTVRCVFLKTQHNYMQPASFRTSHVAIPHPALNPSLRSGRATFPPGEGLVRCKLPGKSKFDSILNLLFPVFRYNGGNMENSISSEERI